MKAIAVVVLVMLTSAAQAETIYKWTDASGGVHYSSTPPSSAEQARARSGVVDTGIRSDPNVPTTDPDYMARQYQGTATGNEAYAAEREARRAVRNREIEADDRAARADELRSRADALMKRADRQKLARNAESLRDAATRLHAVSEGVRTGTPIVVAPAQPRQPALVEPGHVMGTDGTLYSRDGNGNLTSGRDGRVLTPAGPHGYIDTRTGQFVPAQ